MQGPKPEGAEAAVGPSRLGRYTLLEPLGEGGMAKVHLAKKDSSSQIVVLKQLHVQLESNSEAGRRFYREANIASQLNHPAICQVTDAGIEGGRFCLAMEFIAGETVEALVTAAQERGGVLPFEVSIPIMIEALEALAYAHEFRDAEGTPLNLVHRDLSPRNVMVSYSGQVKLIDFGIAKGDIDEYKTAAGTLIGTPYYMSPEQATALQVDQRSDLYSIAAVFWEMLVGERLVKAKGRAKILMSVARDEAPAPSSRNAKVPAAFDLVLRRALEKMPEDRFANARAFQQALRQAAAPYLSTPRDAIGQFVRALFPNGERKAQELLSRAQAHAQEGPVAEPTRIHTGEMNGYVQPTPIQYGDQRDATRTGLTPADGLDLGSQTRTGYLLSPDQPARVFVDTAAPLPMASSTHFGSSSYTGSSTITQVSRAPRFAAAAVVLAALAGGGTLWFLQQGETAAPVEFTVPPSTQSPGVAPRPTAPVVEAKAQAVGVVPIDRSPAPEVQDPKNNRRPDSARPRSDGRETRAEVRPADNPPPTPAPPPAPRSRIFRARLDELRHQTGDPNTAMKLGRALAKDVLAAAEGLPEEVRQVVSAEALRARDRAGTPEQQLEALESALNALEHR
ncbi:MAG: serine/threonine protein kinase [Deltaproteobacteria bacterium]|nr:serine/threonine protein kinase [Deltaproteobacteria bacterium]